jgi:hypothetical protein
VRDELGPPPADVPEGLHLDAAEDTTSACARNADALVSLAKTAVAARASTADAYQVVVHVDADALSVSAETTNGCRLEDGQPLPAAAARRLCCDGSIVRIIERDGNPISLGRKTRTIPPAMRRALLIRDHCCTFPGCTQRAHLDGHHLKHWADGGETNLDNLTSLCRFHHRLLHEGAFTVRGKPGTLQFFTASGKPIPQAPRMPRGHCGSMVSANAQRRVRATPISLWPRETAGENFDLSTTVETLVDSRRRE